MTRHPSAQEILPSLGYRLLFAASVAIVTLLIGLKAAAQTQTREESIANAVVWTQAPWLNEKLEFVGPIDIAKGPQKSGYETVLDQPVVQCRMRATDVNKVKHGMTMKFFCGVGASLTEQTDDKDLKAVKFKYKFDDGEITSEILSTRLFWALGFAADHMYGVEKLECFGCTADPFRDRRVDQSRRKTPRVFENVAAEIKFAPKYIGRGWTFEEMMSTLPRDPLKQKRALIERDALRLLSIFVQHADNKAENQDIACFGKETPDGGCTGPTHLLIQDLGATFGGGQFDHHTVSKANLEAWRAKSLWAEPAKCIANLGMNAEAGMENPQIREESRAFLSTLLTNFSKGADGRARVEAMFRAGHAEMRYGSVEEWTTEFMNKVAEIREPLGKGHPSFKCP